MNNLSSDMLGVAAYCLGAVATVLLVWAVLFREDEE